MTDLILDLKRYHVGYVAMWNHPAFGNALTFFERDINRIRTLAATSRSYIGNDRVHEGNTYNDHYGFGTSIISVIEEYPRKWSRISEGYTLVTATVSESFTMPSLDQYRDNNVVPGSWFQAPDQEDAHRWLAMGFQGQQEHRRKRFDTVTREVVMWDTRQSDETNLSNVKALVEKWAEPEQDGLLSANLTTFYSGLDSVREAVSREGSSKA